MTARGRHRSRAAPCRPRPSDSSTPIDARPQRASRRHGWSGNPGRQAMPARRERTRLPATATLRLAPCPIIGISTHTSALSTCSWGTRATRVPAARRSVAEPAASVVARPLRQRAHRDDHRAGRALLIDPAILARADPMHAWAPLRAQCIAAAECFSVVRGVGHRQARADGIACSQERPRLASNATHNGATIKWSQQPWPALRRARWISPGRDLRALDAPGGTPLSPSHS